MPIQTYQEALDYWHSRVNYEQRGMPTDLGELKLDRMKALLERLGRPDELVPIIHIAGSKGKGSVAAMLAAVLRQAGYRTGLFTSPHLTRVEERIQIDGEPITQDELLPLMQEIERATPAVLAQGQLPPTFFEIVTALGFLHFARQRTELAVVEVGLGGRFDSTNVCEPLLSIITSISFDHTQQLGTTLAAIAMEKAGIIKPGRPTISGVTDPEARQVIAALAAERGAPLTEFGRDFDFTHTPGLITVDGTTRARVAVRTKALHYDRLELNLLGAHQAANAAVVIAAVEQLREEAVEIEDAAVVAGLRDVEWPARLEVLGRRPFVVLDCAHNVASCTALVETLQTSFASGRRLLVLAGSGDKDLQGMLEVLAPQFASAWFTRYTSSQRGARAEELAALWAAAGGLGGQVVQLPSEAWTAARRAARPDDLICVTGSVFLAGELRPRIIAELVAGREAS